MVPAIRLRELRSGTPDPRGAYVLYWMNAYRRLDHSHALDRALEHARALGKPLLILEALRVGYRWASDRHHAFILDGMREHAAALAGSPVGYYPYVEPTAGAGRGLVRALAAQAAVVVTDDWPCFFLPRAVAAAARDVTVPLEAVDTAGLLPLRAAAQAYPMAHAFRRALLKTLRPHLEHLPTPRPLDGLSLPAFAGVAPEVEARWPRATAQRLAGEVADLPIDHRVPRAPYTGGTATARARWRAFLARGYDDYATLRSEPSSGAASGLSPYLHYGHISPFELVEDLRQRHGTSWDELVRVADARSPRWGWPEPAATFVDELVTWRELGLNHCARRTDYAEYTSLPEWARATLAAHAADPRPHLYSRAELEEARTADPIWNAAQRQLVAEGIIHNYLRMLWGKKILEWSRTPEEALDVMIELNNTYALDGRDPNSYSGIFWTLGRYDRPWPERPVFGTIRFMSSDSTKKKLDLTAYLAQWGPRPQLGLGLGPTPTPPKSPPARRGGRS